MPSSIASFAEFDRRLGEARKGIAALVARMPGEQPIGSIQKQLDALHGWTRDGRVPAQEEKDQLNFGQLASRFVSDIDDDLAAELYELASYVTYA